MTFLPLVSHVCPTSISQVVLPKLSSSFANAALNSRIIFNFAHKHNKPSTLSLIPLYFIFLQTFHYSIIFLLSSVVDTRMAEIRMRTPSNEPPNGAVPPGMMYAQDVTPANGSHQSGSHTDNGPPNGGDPNHSAEEGPPTPPYHVLSTVESTQGATAYPLPGYAAYPYPHTMGPSPTPPQLPAPPVLAPIPVSSPELAPLLMGLTLQPSPAPAPSQGLTGVVAALPPAISIPPTSPQPESRRPVREPPGQYVDGQLMKGSDWTYITHAENATFIFLHNGDRPFDAPNGYYPIRFPFSKHKAPCNLTVREFINRLGCPEGPQLGVTEMICGDDNRFFEGDTFTQGDVTSNRTLAEVGWTAARNDNTPVWLAIKE